MLEDLTPKINSCKNCENQFEGIVCNRCGQKVKHFESTPKGLFKEWWSVRKEDFHHFLFTTKELILRPGTVIDEYLGGKRKKYYNSTHYFLLVASLVTFLNIQFRNVDGAAFMEKISEAYASMGVEVPKENQVGAEYFEFFGTHANVSLMLTLPFLALASFWVCGWFFGNTKRYRLGDHFVLQLFLYGLLNLLLVPTIPFVNTTDVASLPLTFGTMLILNMWVFRDMFKGSWFVSFLMSIVFFIMYWLSFFGFIIGLMLVILLLILLIVLFVRLYRLILGIF